MTNPELATPYTPENEEFSSHADELARTKALLEKYYDRQINAPTYNQVWICQVKIEELEKKLAELEESDSL